MNTLDLDTLTLAAGSHDPDDGEMSAMEAVAFIAGEEWTAHPECASPVIGAFMRSWNDALDDDDRQDLKRYILRLVGSKGTAEQEELRGWMALDWLVRVHTPAWLRLAGLNEHADRLARFAEIRPDTVQSVKPVLDAALEATRSVKVAARGAACYPAGFAAMVAARIATMDTAKAATWNIAGFVAMATARATEIAAWDAVGAAAWDTAGVAASVAARAAAAVPAGAAKELAHRGLNRSAHELVDRMLAVTE